MANILFQELPVLNIIENNYEVIIDDGISTNRTTVETLSNYMLPKVKILNLQNNIVLNNIIPANTILKYIIIQNTESYAYTLNIGTANNTNDVVNNANIISSGITTITVNRVFSLSTDQTLYLQSANWNSSNSNIYFLMETI